MKSAFDIARAMNIIWILNFLSIDTHPMEEILALLWRRSDTMEGDLWEYKPTFTHADILPSKNVRVPILCDISPIEPFYMSDSCSSIKLQRCCFLIKNQFFVVFSKETKSNVVF